MVTDDATGGLYLENSQLHVLFSRCVEGLGRLGDVYLTAMAYSGHTCITCAVVFASGDLQRAHYKTDWHRYNLKRKVAELAPVRAEDFKQKVLSQRAADGNARERHSHYCEACRKAFASDKSYESHLRSKKHKEKKETRPPSEVDDGIEDASEGTTDEVIDQTLDNLKNLKIELLEVSLANGNISEAQTVKVKPLHKTEEPTKEVVTPNSSKESSKEKVERVSEDSGDEGPRPLELDECLFCPHVSKDMEHSLKHMSLAHGFFIPDLEYLVDLKGLLEYLCYKVGEERSCLYCQTSRTFYSIEAVQHHMVDKSHCKLFFEGDSALEYAEFYDYTKSYAKPGEEEPSSAEDESDLPVPDNSLEVNEDLELVLPSGSKLSHRAMRQYFKQRLPTLEQRTSSVVARLMAQYRAIGWKGAGEGEVGKRAAMDETLRLRMQQKRQLKLSMSANKQQHHFRPQVVF